MPPRIVIPSLAVVILLASCSTEKKLLISDACSNFDTLKITTVQDFESKNKSKDITPAHPVEIGQGIYPNSNNYKLEMPRVFRRQEKPHFTLEIDYYYTATDSSVKVILYQWDDIQSKTTELSQRQIREKFYSYQAKFSQLADSLTNLLGRPILKDLEQSKSGPDQTFRDDIKWKSGSGLNAYLFMLGNNNAVFRQIRLAIYKD